MAKGILAENDNLKIQIASGQVVFYYVSKILCICVFYHIRVRFKIRKHLLGTYSCARQN